MTPNTREIASEAEFDALMRDVATPMLVDFWGENCPACRAIAPTLELLAGEYAGRAAIVKVNTDRFMAIAQRFGVRALPTVLLFEGGVRKATLTGSHPRSYYQELLDAALGARSIDKAVQAVEEFGQAFFDAITGASTDKLRKIITEHPSVLLDSHLQASEKKHPTPLLAAILNGRPELVQLLTPAGVKLSLAELAATADAYTLKQALDAGDDTRIVARDIGWGPLAVAALSGRRENFQLLLDEAVRRKEASRKEAIESVLIYVTRSDDAAFLASVLEEGIDVNIRGLGGMTVLHDCVARIAMERPKGEVTRLEQLLDILLNAGADPFIAADQNLTAIGVAERAGEDELADRLRQCASRSRAGAAGGKS